MNVAAANDPTTVTLTMSPTATTIALGQPVAVTMAGTYAPNAVTTEYSLDWGDMSTGGYQLNNYSPSNVTSDYETFSHTYAAAGTYTLEGFLTGKGTGGGAPGFSIVYLTVTVVGPPAALAPGASFVPSPTDPVAEPAAGLGEVTPAVSDVGGRYEDGLMFSTATDFESDGFGGRWGQDRSWSNLAGYDVGSTGGNGWVLSDQPRLFKTGSSLVEVSAAGVARYFDGQGSPDGNGNYATYTARYNGQAAVTYDSTPDEFVVDDGSGGQVRFYGFGTSYPAGQPGGLKSKKDAYGDAVSATWDGAERMTEVTRSATVGGTTDTESILYTYLAASNPNANRMATATLRRKVGAGSYSTVRTVEYEYYTPSEANGNVGPEAGEREGRVGQRTRPVVLPVLHVEHVAGGHRRDEVRVHPGPVRASRRRPGGPMRGWTPPATRPRTTTPRGTSSTTARTGSRR